LLQTTQKTILHVAMDVGYESEAAFNRAFKREFGLPPAQYRRKLAADGADRPMRFNGEDTSSAVQGTLSHGPVAVTSPS
jgi:AraC-like DNA-binding protein